jgi:hypothetical protein
MTGSVKFVKEIDITEIERKKRIVSTYFLDG